MSEEENLSMLEQFKQQRMPAWHPIPTLTKTIILFSVIGSILVALGVPMLISTLSLVEVVMRYDDSCSGQPTCQLFLSLPFIPAPIYVYYELANFFQNHRLYANSISYDQLSGSSVSASLLETSCSPIVYNRDLYVSVSVTGAPLDPAAVAFPCGQVAYTVFNDSFLLNGSITIEDNKIAWPSDVARYKGLNRTNMWLDLTSQRVMNWLRIAALPTFRKTWGVISTDIPANNYSLTIQNNYNFSAFGVEKSFVIGNTNLLGSRNLIIPIIYLAAGLFCYLAAFVFLVRKVRKTKQG